MSPLEDCCVTCRGCGRVFCTQNEVSPGEIDSLCPPCWTTEDDE